MQIAINASASRKCVAVIILEDQKPEATESFLVRAEELGQATRVLILDDDGMYVCVCVVKSRTTKSYGNF